MLNFHGVALSFGPSENEGAGSHTATHVRWANSLYRSSWPILAACWPLQNVHREPQALESAPYIKVIYTWCTRNVSERGAKSCGSGRGRAWNGWTPSPHHASDMQTDTHNVS